MRGIAARSASGSIHVTMPFFQSFSSTSSARSWDHGLRCLLAAHRSDEEAALWFDALIKSASAPRGSNNLRMVVMIV